MPTGGGFAFGPFQLDPGSRRLTRNGIDVPIPTRQLDLLIALLQGDGAIVIKDDLMKAAWGGVVAENSLAKGIMRLRAILGDDDGRYIQTATLHGYRFAAPIAPIESRQTDDDLDLLLGPHRAWIDGRIALETLVVASIARARSGFQQLVDRYPKEPAVHVGLANACALTFENTRAGLNPDVDALQIAAAHAREAWQLSPHYAEAWATLGFVLERTGDRAMAIDALHRAVTLDGRNWCHWLRFAYGSCGGQRLSAATRVLELLEGCPLAHVLIATVFIARGALAEAEREIDAAIAALPLETEEPAPFSTVALFWLKGLLLLARNEEDDALAFFQRELALEPRGYLYGRECAANTLYAIGVCHLRRGKHDAALAAFRQAIERVPRHPMSHVGVALCADGPRTALVGHWPLSIEDAVAHAALFVARGETPDAVQLVTAALAAAPPGSAGWTIPIDPLLNVERDRATWRAVLVALKGRAV